MVLVYIAVAYFAVVWIGLRLITPHLGFRKEALPSTIPSELSRTIDRLNTEATDDFDFLKKAFANVTATYKGSRIKTITHFWTAFKNPIGQKPGFMVCSGQNYLLRLMLVKSGRFNESDIEIKVTPLNLFIHQYLRVRANNTWFDVDPWSSFKGVPLGKKSSIIG